jgi:metal-dependent amidase/aminoacylase/carboxypeptidase family protein
MALDDRMRSDVAELEHDAIELRHRLHRRPEIGLELPETQRAVLDALAGLPLEVSTGSSCSSVTAVLRGTGAAAAEEQGGAGRPRPAVLLRGDMDALPVREATGLEFASTVDGAMHAC